MYWYYKYPLYAILAIILFGIGSLIYSRLPEGLVERREQENETARRQTADDMNAREPAGQTRQTAVRDPQVLRQLRAAQRQLEEGNLLAARTLARNAMQRESVRTFDPEWRQAADVISDVNTMLLNSDIPAPEKVRHEVVRGDSLVAIAKTYNTTVGAVQRSNPRLDATSDRIFPGMIIHVYEGDWSIDVVKSEYVLMLMDGDDLFKLYDVAIGAHGRTPAGEFVVTTKLVEPDWTPPGRIIPYGDPENVLGTRWLGIAPTGDTDPTLRGYGIHGTWEPESIGTQASQGCVRMNNADVEELYDVVRHGTPVTIRGE